MTTLSRESADWIVSLKHDDIQSNVIESAKAAFPDREASVLGFDLRPPAPNAVLAVLRGRKSISDVSGSMSLRRPA